MQADEAELLRRILAGESELYSQIVHRYQGRIYAALQAMVPSREDAEDLTQESLVLAYRKLASFEARSSFYTWLHRIAMNLALSHRRSHRKELSQAWSPMEVASESLSGREEASDVQLERLEEQQLVQQAMARLDASYRAILVLRDIQQLDYAQIAEILEIPAGTVRSRLHRARLELKGTLQMLLDRQASPKRQPD